MRSIKLGNYEVNDESLPFFISEVGSNHQGASIIEIHIIIMI